MCIINNSYNFIFIHIPKSAGSSVTEWLSSYTRYCDLEIGATEFGEEVQSSYVKRFGISKHSTAIELRTIVGQDNWDRYYKFAFVRNPFTRCLSTYNFLQSWDGAEPDFCRIMKGFSSFEEFVFSGIWDSNEIPDNILQPQMHWIQSNPNGDKVLVDYVGKVETIDSDMAKILDAIGIPEHLRKNIDIPRLNVSKQHSINEISDARVIDKIVKKYQVDFASFGYSTDPKSILC